ncbi:MAG: hypothetical protein DMG57_11460 [Acidobacteria bacterium]|nr:MAG: hypothetical protein DMG57_11460 [Acidobacteriota bacterium]
MRPGANAAIAFLICGFVFVVYVLSPISQSSDSFWTVPVMLSLLAEDNIIRLWTNTRSCCAKNDIKAWSVLRKNIK